MNRRSALAGLVLAGVVASVSSAKTINWNSRTPLPLGLVGHGAVDVSGTLFVIGGGNADATILSASVFAYSRQTDTWLPRAPMPGPRSCFGAAAIGNTIYVMGGAVFGSSTVSCLGYNTTTDVWFPVAPMPGPVQSAGCAATPLNVFIMGGITQPGAVYRDVNYQYNPGPNSWVIRPNVPSPARVGPVAAFAQGKIYLIGGYGSGVLANVEEYDPAAPGWVTRNPLPRGHSEATVAVIGGTVYVMGGSLTAGPTNAVDILDAPRDVSWQGPNMAFNRNGAAAAAHQGVIQITGGYSTYPAPDSNNEEGWLGSEVAGAVSPPSLVFPGTFTVSLTVTNTSWANANNVTPKLQINTMAMSVTMFVGPTPAGPLTVGPGAVQTFSWTFSATGPGTVSITMTAVGSDAVTGKAIVERALVSVVLAAPPSAPIALTAKGMIGQVNLSWLPAGAGTSAISGYRIYRTTATAVAYTQVGATLGGMYATAFTDTTITNGRPYLYKTEAFDLNVPPITGALSNAATATPFLPSTAPVNLTLKAMSTKLTLYWNVGTIGSNGLNGFDVWRKTGPGTDTLVGQPSGGVTYYNDTPLVNGTTYTYWMMQRDTLGNLSASSFSASDAPRSGPFAPSSITAAPGNNQVILSWAPGTAGTFSPTSGYSVYRGATLGTLTFLAGPVLTEGFTDATAGNGSAYYYTVRTRDALGHESPDSTDVLLGPSVLNVNPPVAVTAFASAGSVRVSWQPAAVGDPSSVGTPSQYAVSRATCAACNPTTSVYVPSTASAYMDPGPFPAGVAQTYRVRTRTTLGFESEERTGINIAPPLAFPLLASLTIQPTVQNPGGTFDITISMTNTGGSLLTLQTAALGAFRGAGLVSLTGGPAPPPGGQPIPAAMQQAVAWSYTAGGTGVVGFTCTASAVDQATGLTVWAVASATALIVAVPPGTPGTPSVSAVPGTVNVSWVAAAPGSFPVSGYRIYRTTTMAISPVQVGTALQAGTVFTDTTVTNGTFYLYRVEAFDTGVPPVTGAVSGYGGATPFIAPPAPSGLSLIPLNGSVMVSWTLATPGSFALQKVHVWRKTGAGSFALATQLGPTATSYEDMSLVNGTAYSYLLVAQDVQDNYSASSFIATEYPHDGPYAPATFTAAAGNQRVLLSWSPGTAGTFALSGYSVYRGLAPGSESFYAGPLFTQTWTDASVANGTTYYYVLRSRDSLSHESANSTERAVTPTAGNANPPTGVAAVATPSGVVVSWSPAATGDPGTVGTPTEYVIVRSTCAACGPSASQYVSSTSSVWVDTNPLDGGVSYAWTVRTRTSLGFESGDVSGVNISPPVAFPLTAALSVTPGSAATGSTMTVVVTVTNTGGTNVDVQSLVLGLYRGAGLVGAPTGPTPALVTVPGGGSASFTWTTAALTAGAVGFSVTVTALDQGTTQTGWLVLAAAVTIVTPPVTPTLSTDPGVRLLAKVKSGGIVVGPNAFRHGSGAVMRIALRGDADGRPTVRIFDEAGRVVRTLDVTLDADGLAVATYDVADAGGRPLAPGMYFIVGEGDGVSDRRVIVVRGAK